MLQAADLKDYLIPVPKQVEQSSGTFNRKEGRIVIPENSPLLIEIAAVIKSCLAELEIVTAFAAKTAIGEDPLVWVYLNPGLSSQEYKVAVQSNRILLEGGDEAGLFYALQTFKQIVRYAKDRGGLPLISIKDSPDFKRRGILLDVSRNKVPTMSTLKNLIDYFASWKINEVQLYTENTFAYQNHREVWEGFSPMTAEEILELDLYCRERFIDLVPNQASFAHMNQWFEHDRYKGLAEVSGPSSHINLSPAVPETMELMSELYAELLPNFSSRYFNINCDETDYLGKGQTKEWVEKKGKGRVYFDFLMQLKNEVEKHSRKVLFWGDIILQNPELIPELPKDMIALVWGYLADFPFDEYGKKFREAGIPFYVCPGTSSVLSFVGRNQNAFENLRNAAMNGIEHGAMGILNTDWGNNGHWQPISVSYPAFLYGAAVSWGFKNNENMNIGKMISRYIFNDPTEKSGDALINIGNAYTLPLMTL
ncbi:MAG: family 20 glycosylhydrolase [Chitinophagaceae bacterium]|nr:family 20 glycosylhydrolase [Chitinophagaceae bacterium]